jgi:tetrahydromethanopterin S-methyltransferase subunit A
MAKGEFKLVARIESEDIRAIEPIIKNFIGTNGSISSKDDEIVIEATVKGENAKDLNRRLLSEMRRVVKKTRLRSEWSSSGVTEKFFDYVSKGKRTD